MNSDTNMGFSILPEDIPRCWLEELGIDPPTFGLAPPPEPRLYCLRLYRLAAQSFAIKAV